MSTTPKKIQKNLQGIQLTGELTNYILTRCNILKIYIKKNRQESSSQDKERLVSHVLLFNFNKHHAELDFKKKKEKRKRMTLKSKTEMFTHINISASSYADFNSSGLATQLPPTIMRGSSFPLDNSTLETYIN